VPRFGGEWVEVLGFDSSKLATLGS